MLKWRKTRISTKNGFENMADNTEKEKKVDMSGLCLDSIFPNPSINLAAITKLNLSNNNLQEMGVGCSSGNSSNPIGQGRPQGRPKGSGRPKGNKDSSCSDKYVDDPGSSLTLVYTNENSSGQSKSSEEVSGSVEQKKEIAFGQDFDLNLDYEENLKVLGVATDRNDIKREEHCGLSTSDMAGNKPPVVNVTRSFEEEEEDYDNEED